MQEIIVRSLELGNLPPSISQEEIRMVCGAYGDIEEVRIGIEPDEMGRRRAMVVFCDSAGSDACATVVNGMYRFDADARKPIEAKRFTSSEEYRFAKWA